MIVGHGRIQERPHLRHSGICILVWGKTNARLWWKFFWQKVRKFLIYGKVRRIFLDETFTKKNNFRTEILIYTPNTFVNKDVSFQLFPFFFQIIYLSPIPWSYMSKTQSWARPDQPVILLAHPCCSSHVLCYFSVTPTESLYYLVCIISWFLCLLSLDSQSAMRRDPNVSFDLICYLCACPLCSVYLSQQQQSQQCRINAPLSTEQFDCFISEVTALKDSQIFAA